MASIIDDIFTIQEFDIAGISEDAGDTHRGDILEVVFQDSLYFSSNLIVEEKVKAFIRQAP